MKATVKNIFYTPGDYTITNGHKQNEKHHYKNGKYITPTGFGWASEYTPSTLILQVIIEGKIHNISVGRFFKDAWGRLTQKRQNAIMNTVPSEVTVEENQIFKGELYYTVCDSELWEWFKRAEQY